MTDGDAPRGCHAQRRTGVLETSNVNVADAMVNMIELSRRFEMQVRTMTWRRKTRRNAATRCRGGCCPGPEPGHADEGKQDTHECTALWAAKTGLDAQQTRMTVVSHNLANVNTTGFKKDRAVFEDLLYQNVRQVGAATSQDTRAPTGLYLGTGVRVVATEKIYHAGQPRADRQFARRGDQRPRLLPGADAGWHARLHARRRFPDERQDGELVTSSGYACSRPSRIPAGAQSVTIGARWRGQRAAGRAVGADAGRHAAADRFRQPGRPAAARREPAARDRASGPRADRHAGPNRPRHAAAGLRSKARTSTWSRSSST